MENTFYAGGQAVRGPSCVRAPISREKDATRWMDYGGCGGWGIGVRFNPYIVSNLVAIKLLTGGISGGSYVAACHCMGVMYC